MSDSRPGSADEKITLKDNEKKRFFWQKAKPKADPKDVDHDEKDSLPESAVTPEPVEPELNPVGFTEMFRCELLSTHSMPAFTLSPGSLQEKSC